MMNYIPVIAHCFGAAVGRWLKEQFANPGIFSVATKRLEILSEVLEKYSKY